MPLIRSAHGPSPVTFWMEEASNMRAAQGKRLIGGYGSGRNVRRYSKSNMRSARSYQRGRSWCEMCSRKRSLRDGRRFFWELLYERPLESR